MRLTFLLPILVFAAARALLAAPVDEPVLLDARSPSAGSGLRASAERAPGGLPAAEWVGYGTRQPAILAAPAEWTPYRQLRFWVRAAGARGVRLEVRVAADDPATPEEDFWYHGVRLEGDAWQQVRVSIPEGFAFFGHPTGWERLGRLSLACAGVFGLAPRPGARVWIAGVRLHPEAPPRSQAYPPVRTGRPEHPSLLFGPADIPKLRARAETEAGKILWQRVATESARWADQPDTLAASSGTTLSYRCMTALQAAALRTALGSVEDAAIVERAARALLSLETWITPDPLRLPVDLSACRAAFSLALAYDLACPHLSPELRRAIGEAVLARCLRPLVQALDQGAACLIGYEYNYSPYMLGCAGFASLALRGDFPEADACLAAIVAHARRCLDAQDPAGGCGEGTYYWSFGLAPLAVFARALSRATDGRVDLLGHPFFRAACRFGIQTYLGNQRVVLFGDGPSSLRSPALPLLLASHFRDGVLQGAAVEMAAGPQPYVAHTLSFLLYDPDLPAQPRGADAVQPLYASVGLVALRAFPADLGEVAFALRTGANTAHSHLDVGSLVLHAAGDELADDPGMLFPYPKDYWTPGGKARCSYSSSLAHSVLLLDGMDQSESPAGEGTVGACFDGPAVAFVASEARGVYPADVTTAERCILFLKPQRFLVLDRVAAGREHDFEWRLQSRLPPQPLEAGGVGLVGERAGLRVELFGPPDAAPQYVAEPAADPVGECRPVRFAVPGRRRSLGLAALLDVARAGTHWAACQAQPRPEGLSLLLSDTQGRTTVSVSYEPRVKAAVVHEDLEGRLCRFALLRGRAVVYRGREILSSDAEVCADLAVEERRLAGRVLVPSGRATLSWDPAGRPESATVRVDGRDHPATVDETRSRVTFTLNVGAHDVTVEW